MTRRISAQQLDQYERDGALFPVPVLSPAEVAMYRDELAALESQHLGTPLKRVESLHMFFDWAYRLVTHDAIVDVVEDILGPNILIAGTLVIRKPPHDKGYVSWHQDSVYSGWHKTPSTSAWIALSPSQPGNGCMRVIPCSHKDGLLDHVNVQDSANLLDRGESVDIDVDESRAVDLALRPGEMSLHQSTIIHGSNPNTSSEPRIGFIARYVTNQIEGGEQPLMRIRGDADCGHLELVQPPVGSDRKEALAGWRSAVTETSPRIN